MNDINSQTKKLDDLVDIRDVQVDRSLPTEERIRSFVEQIKDPYCFRVGNVKVKVSYAKRDETLDDSFSTMISSM